MSLFKAHVGKVLQGLINIQYTIRLSSTLHSYINSSACVIWTVCGGVLKMSHLNRSHDRVGQTSCGTDPTPFSTP